MLRRRTLLSLVALHWGSLARVSPWSPCLQSFLLISESHQTFQVHLINISLIPQPGGASQLDMPTAAGGALSCGTCQFLQVTRATQKLWHSQGMCPAPLQMPRSQLSFIAMDNCFYTTCIFYSRADFTSFSFSASIQAPTFLGEPFCFHKATPFYPFTGVASSTAAIQ